MRKPLLLLLGLTIAGLLAALPAARALKVFTDRALGMAELHGTPAGEDVVADGPGYTMTPFETAGGACSTA